MGLAGKYFDFSSSAQLLLTGSGPPGEPVALVTPFGYTFQFDQAYGPMRVFGPSPGAV
jgi:hypothetical protein